MVSCARLPCGAVPPRTIESDAVADLVEIVHPEVNLCVVHRRSDHGLDGFIARIAADCWRLETLVRIDAQCAGLEHLLPPALRAQPGVDAWMNDVAELVRIFHDLFAPDAVGLRLRTLDYTMCPRFHVDNLPVRLVCTYGGVGTQWLPEEAVDRTKLGRGAGGLSDAESGLILDAAAIRTLPLYAIGLLKGDTWAGNQGRGLVHRSPSPTPEQPCRVLLTLDAV